MSEKITPKEINDKVDKLLALKLKQDKIAKEIDDVRNELFAEMKKNKISQFNNGVANVYPVKTKTLKFDRPKEDIIKEMKELDLKDYFHIETIEDLTPEFVEAIKNGEESYDGISLQETTRHQVKFNKQ